MDLLGFLVLVVVAFSLVWYVHRYALHWAVRQMQLDGCAPCLEAMLGGHNAAATSRRRRHPAVTPSPPPPPPASRPYHALTPPRSALARLSVDQLAQRLDSEFTRGAL
jgi:hypothetical protein